ncbi:MAG: thiamine diphosphokinase [Clostridia bacterium]|nr:thiamine diphosphokinase [Clostridia bacterium]
MLKHPIPFKAALFDLDGTLLDSNGVWQEVDREFFEARGVALDHEDYARAVQGMSFREAAEYTVRRYGLQESVEAVMDEWMRMAREEYAHRVALKSGALDYLRMLKRAGVKLAVVTANREELFGPALERGGALALFDAICTSAEVGNVGKADGALFLLAAKRLGAEPGDCAVFEDVLDGIAGAKRAGMRAYAVRDAATEHSREAIAALADGVIDGFADMRRFHAFPPSRRCVIFTAHCQGDVARAYAPRPGDFILCADGGWELACRAGVRPDWVIGDFDSSEEPGNVRTERVPVEKDDTDTMLCLKRGIALGYGEILIIGGFGGRFDHTLANIQTLHYAAAHHVRAELRDGEQHWAAAVRDGALRVSAPRPIHGGAVKLSVFALSDVCRGVCIRGTHYDAEGITLTNAFPLGVSNSFARDSAEIVVAEGTLLVTVCEE